MAGLDYSQRLEHTGLETLQLRKIKYDLLMCYKILLLVEKSPCIAIFWICRTVLKQEDINTTV